MKGRGNGSKPRNPFTATSIIPLDWKTNIDQAVNLELTDAIPKALLSDHTDHEGTLTANVTLILDHMEDTYDKIHRKDINNAMKTFNTEFDGTTTVYTYFDRQ